MHRFFVSCRNIFKEKIIISDIKDIRHLKKVLRLESGDKIVLFDETGREFTGLIDRANQETVSVRIIGQGKRADKASLKLTLACAIPKGNRMDEIVDKLTQLGVSRIIPFISERVIVNLDDKRRHARIERWRRIARASASQSQRNTLPAIDSISNLNEVLGQFRGFDLKLVPTILGERKSLKDIFGKSKFKEVMVLIGPEGDFTKAEIEQARASGFVPVTLGETVLRVETAAIAVAGFIRLYADS